MSKQNLSRRARALAVAAAAATALVGMVPLSAAAEAGGPDTHDRRGYVCDRLERDGNAAVGSSRCRAFHAPRRGHVRGTFTIESRRGHHKVVCRSGYANLPNWVRGEHCRRA